MLTRYCFLDFETSGINHETDYPLQVGAVLGEFQHGQFQVYHQLESLIQIPTTCEIHPGAFKIHGISKGDLKGVPTPFEFLEEFEDTFQTDYSFAGWNVWFDVGFFKKLCAENQKEDFFRKIGYRHLDVQSVYQFLRMTYFDSGPSLNEACEHLGLSRSKHHNALEDVLLEIEVANQILHHLK